MKWVFLFFLMLCLKVYAQYPFEKYPAVKYKKANFKESKSVVDSSIAFLATNGLYKVRLLTGEISDGYNIIVYKNNKVYQKFKGEPIDPITVDKPLFVGDIDGNGKVDLKIVLYNNGSGLAGSLERKIYLFGDKEGKFDMVFFYGLFF